MQMRQTTHSGNVEMLAQKYRNSKNTEMYKEK